MPTNPTNYVFAVAGSSAAAINQTGMVITSELRLAKRMGRLGTETAFEVLVKARALEAKGRDIVHLEIGEPDFDTPGNIIEAAADALHKGFTHYGPAGGLPRLRAPSAQ